MKGGGGYGEVPAAVLFASYPRIRAEINRYFEPAVGFANKMIQRCDELALLFSRVKESLRRETAERLGSDGTRDEDPFDLVFVTPDRVEDSLPEPYRPIWYFDRTLGPIAKNEDELRDILCGNNGILIYSGAFRRLLSDCFLREGELPGRLVAEVVRNGACTKPDLIVREFSFLKVLERNRPYWNEWWRRESSNDDHVRNRVLERFRKNLGADPSETGTLPPPEVLVHMTAAMLCVWCSPWWRTEPVHEQSAGFVFVPMVRPSKGSDLYECLENLVREWRSAERNWDIIWTTEKGPFSPFSVVSFVEESALERRGPGHPLDRILSFDYWRDEQVLALLAKAEQPDGESVFSDDFGYISPRFVRDPEIAAKRWRPWMGVQGSGGSGCC